MINRRAFAKIVGTGAATASLAGLSSASAAAAMPGGRKPVVAPTVKPGTHTSFGSLKQINAGVLNIGYAEAGPANGPAVILLHGWPYDIHSYVDVAPLLAAQGYRVIVPYLRGHGTTRFLSERTPRNAQQSVVALDIIALMDALKIEKAVLAGYDWGSRTADIIAALWPERCKALVSVTGYLITNREKQKTPLPPQLEWAWWYQYYFATDRGVEGLKTNRHDLAKLVWTFNSPTWRFDDATFERTAAAFENPDYVSIVIHNYRWRLGLAKGDPRYDRLEDRLAKGPVIAVPTIILDGEKDPFTPARGDADYRAKFTGEYAHRTLNGIGHNVPQEAPEAFTQAVIDVDGF
jgi:pimeloyl-ACP methyl ester carboxylesterase